MLTTTLSDIRACKPTPGTWKRLLKGLGETRDHKKPLPIERILEPPNFDDALWALRVVKDHDGAIRLFVCYCARYVLDIFEREYPGDKRPREAIEMAERFVRGQATHEELAAARDSVLAAVAVQDLDAAKLAAYAAVETARDAVGRAAKDIVDIAGQSTAWAFGDTAWETALDDFKHEFISLCRLEGEYAAFRKI